MQLKGFRLFDGVTMCRREEQPHMAAWPPTSTMGQTASHVL
jgi:hypothetical protein